jgi:membrane fusion protein, multidrug efflux system
MLRSASNPLRRGTSTRLATFAFILAMGWGAAPAHGAAALKTHIVGGAESASGYSTDATVEALRDARIASQVPGRIVALPVRAGERVQAGQVLVRIDASVVSQQVVASQAQLAQAEAQAVVARNELQRARQLFAKSYVSQAALDQAEAQARAAQAEVKALTAQVGAASAQAGLHVLHAPFAGWVAQVPVSLGDVAGPGQTLMQLYDPSALRVSAQVPESVVSRLQPLADVTLVRTPSGSDSQARAAEPVTLSGLKAEVLPAVDPVSRTVTVRVALPAVSDGVHPGQSVKVSLAWRLGAGSASASSAGATARLTVPRSAVVVRSELQGVYTVDRDGGVRLRQVRLGRVVGEAIEVLAGLNAGEQVALDPVAAAKASASNAAR